MPEEGLSLDHIRDAIVGAPATIRDAMVALNRSAVGVVLVVEEGVLLGTVTDGDLRRALLAGAVLDDRVGAHMRRDYTSVLPAAGRAEALDLMRALAVQQIPIVDQSRRLRGLHLLREIIGAVQRPNWGVIMAGGKGMRLRPLTEVVPKPMIRVAGRPILERLVLHMVGFGIRRLFLSINYLGSMIEEHFGDGSQFGCTIEYLREEQPLGTGGSLSLLPTMPTDPVVVLNGDLVTQADLGSLLDFHSAGTQDATIAVRRYLHTVPFGCVDLEDGRIAKLEEKPQLVRLVNAGIYVLDPSVIATMEKGQECSLPDVIGRCLREQREVRAFELNDDWIDVGQWEQLRLAREGAPH